MTALLRRDKTISAASLIHIQILGSLYRKGSKMFFSANCMNSRLRVSPSSVDLHTCIGWIETAWVFPPGSTWACSAWNSLADRITVRTTASIKGEEGKATKLWRAVKTHADAKAGENHHNITWLRHMGQRFIETRRTFTMRKDSEE